MKHGKLKAVSVVIIGLLLGYAIAAQLNGFLGIEFIPKDLPVEVVPDEVPALEASAPMDTVSAVVLPGPATERRGY